MGCDHGKTVEDSGSRQGLIRNPKVIFEVSKNCTAVSLLALDNDRLLIGEDKEVKLYCNGSKELKSLFTDHKGRVNCMIKLKNGQIASGSQDKTIKIWSIDSPGTCSTLEGHTSIVWSIAQVNDDQLVSAGDDKQLILWNIKAKKQDALLYTSKSGIGCVMMHSSGKLIVGTGADQLMIWDVKNKKAEADIEVKSGVWSLVELKDRKIVAGCGSGAIQIWNLDKKHCESVLEGHPKMCVNVLLLVDGTTFVSAADAKEMFLWNSKDPKGKFTMVGHEDCVSALALTPNGRIISGARDNTIKIWE